MGLFDRLRKKKAETQTPEGTPRSFSAEASGPQASGSTVKQVMAKDAEDALKVVRRLVGKNINGIPALQTRPGGPTTYVVLDPATDEVYQVTNVGGEWTVSLMKAKGAQALQGGQIKTIWTTARSDPATQYAQQMIKAFVPAMAQFNLRYLDEMRELESDISRKAFQSDEGPVRIHTRRASGGTEGFIEITKLKTCLLFFHNTTTGEAKMTGKVAQPPF